MLDVFVLVRSHLLIVPSSLIDLVLLAVICYSYHLFSELLLFEHNM